MLQPHLRDYQRSAGVTLVELLIVIAIAGILTTMALPSFRYVIGSIRQTSQVNAMVGALNFARSEAVKRQASVKVCKSDINNAVCGVGTERWGQYGWIVALVGTPDTILKIYPPLKSGATLGTVLTLTPTSSFNSLTFAANGQVSNSNRGRFIFCQDWSLLAAPTATAKYKGFMSALIVNNVGQVRQARDSNGDGWLEDQSGAPITTCP